VREDDRRSEAQDDAVRATARHSSTSLRAVRRRVRRWRTLHGLLRVCGAFTGLWLVASCGSGSDGGTQVVPTEEAPLVSDLRIDGRQADLVPVHFLALRSDGTLAVGQPIDSAIRFFDSGGVALATVGRAGEGPGEFRGLNQAGWMGDTLWVSDGRLNRVTFISPDLSVARTTPLPAGARPQPADIGRYPEFSRISPSAIHPDGTLGASLVIPGGPLAEQWDDQWTWHFRITAEGRIVHAIGREPDSGHPDYSYYHSFSNGSVRGWPFPFVYRPRFVWAPSGDRVAYVSADQTDASAATVDAIMLDASGDTIFAERYRAAGEQLPRSVADSTIAAIAAARLGEAADVWASQAQAHVPSIYPPIEPGSFIGNDGRLWVRLRGTPEATRYLLLDADGRQTGTVKVAANVVLRTADASHAWGVELDEHDVPSLVRFRLPDP
jgi:hypothetical protein